MSGRPDWRQWLTLACLVALVVAALGFHLEIGFLALAAGALLVLVDMKRQEKAVDGVSWCTLLLVAGAMTYIAMLEKAGVIEIIPVAVPLLLSSHLIAAGLIAALAISTTIVDTSPFSTNGALVLSNACGVDPRRFYRQVIGYTGGIVACGPVVAWGALVLPWS